MTIEELAARSGMTVRNIRAYQTRGLLPAPELRGRTGIYGEHHVARLRLIRELQAEGVNLQGIKWFLDKVPPEVAASSHEIRQLQESLLPSWEAEKPFVISTEEVVRRFGGGVTAEAFKRAQELHVLAEAGPGRWRVLSPTLFHVGEEVVALGLSLPAALDALEQLHRELGQAAGGFVSLMAREIWGPFEQAGRPTDRWPQVRRAIERLRPLSTLVMQAAFRQEMDRALRRAILEVAPQGRAGHAGEAPSSDGTG